MDPSYDAMTLQRMREQSPGDDRRLNALRMYMDFYRQARGSDSAYSRGTFGSSLRDLNADAMDFASGQVGQETPEFFNSQGPQYVEPRPVQTLAREAGFPLAPQDQTQTQRRPVSDMREMGLNYLRNLLRR